MHSCWSPVPKCRPSFQQLVSQLEALHLNLSPRQPPKEPLLYVNLEGEESGADAGGGAWTPDAEGAADSCSWRVPWQQQVEETDWLMPVSRAALGDYRYIFGPQGIPEEEETAGEVQDEEDTVINL